MGHRSPARAAWAGLACFGIVFVAGFALGTLRVLVLAPRFGVNAAVLVELPIILALSWAACRWLIKRFDVPPVLTARLVMGGLAFAVLMFAEIGVSVLGFRRTLSAHLEQYRQMHALIGLAGQIVFAMLPIIQQTNDHNQRAS
ncbi:MAG: hypothetical protein K2Y71_26910 [Xanthobacteraceae bacterium]|nr:hypothetical protein [Xanthobacteraceae bacterium]